jgi:hypothetical protein
MPTMTNEDMAIYQVRSLFPPLPPSYLLATKVGTYQILPTWLLHLLARSSL